MNSTRHKARTEGLFHKESESDRWVKNLIQNYNDEKLIRVECYKKDYKNNIPCRIEFFDSIEDADKLLHKFHYNNIFYFDNKSDRLLLHECGDIASIEESTIKIGKKESQTVKKAPIFTFCKQMKSATEALALRSLYGHNKYKEYDKDWQNFSRVEDADFEYSNASFRHALGIGEDSEEDHYIATAWNAIARLEVYLREKNNEVTDTNNG